MQITRWAFFHGITKWIENNSSNVSLRLYFPFTSIIMHVLLPTRNIDQYSLLHFLGTPHTWVTMPLVAREAEAEDPSVLAMVVWITRIKARKYMTRLLLFVIRNTAELMRFPCIYILAFIHKATHTYAQLHTLACTDYFHIVYHYTQPLASPMINFQYSRAMWCSFAEAKSCCCQMQNVVCLSPSELLNYWALPHLSFEFPFHKSWHFHDSFRYRQNRQRELDSDHFVVLFISNLSTIMSVSYYLRKHMGLKGKRDSITVTHFDFAIRI